MTLPLFIFEERYKKMVRDCVDDNQRRLVITLAKARSNLNDGGASVSEVGSFVDILSVSENPDGTYNILVHGQERCSVDVADTLSVRAADGSENDLYYTKGETYPLERTDPNAERVTAWDTLDVFRDYARTFFAFDAVQQIEEALPEDLVYQASFICANIRVPAESRQVLLEAPSLTARFQIARNLMQERIDAHRPTSESDSASK